MKILHTSDWHLGQNFYNKSRKNEHELFLHWLLNQIGIHSIDAVIVAGDIFDTSTPPSYAREMYNQFVVEINRLNCQLVILGGNHDSVSVLNETKQLLKYLNTDVIANTTDDIKSQVIELKDKNKNIGALVCAIPFIRPRDVLISQAGKTGAERQQQLGEAITTHYHRIYQHAIERRNALDNNANIPIIATGHLTALGVSQSDSVRDFYIGNLNGFAADNFPPADYIALGHIHRPQIVAKSEHIRYCGSPIPLSFDELKTTKQVYLIEFSDGQRTITPLDIPCFQLLAELKGNLSEIEQQLAEFRDSKQTVWLSIIVSIQDYLSNLQEKISLLTKDLNVEVLQLKRARERRNQTLEQQVQETLSELTPMDVFEKRLALESFTTEEDLKRLGRMSIMFQQILSDVEHNYSTAANNTEVGA